MEAISLIRERVAWCEAAGVEILCCPEAVLGGLADYAERPAASRSTLLVASWTPSCHRSRARLWRPSWASARPRPRGSGVSPGRGRRRASQGASGHPHVGLPPGRPCSGLPDRRADLRHPHLQRLQLSRAGEEHGRPGSDGALFIPTNNGLPPERADVADHARRVDVALARENGVSVIRADVAGRADGRVSFGSSAIVGVDGTVLRSAPRLAEDLLVADIDVA
jgi:hypothetical protein